ncbi:peptidase S8 family protein [Pleurotus pulmonarius]|nr:pheromone processing endoprotease [Pleurotus pulmonarius]KAF4603397.1 pheromone processing endoprotease [Pleurotus pulmonarius]
MLLSWTLLLAFFSQQNPSFVFAATPAKRFYDTHKYYVIEHNPRAPSGAPLDDVARSLGVEVVERAGELEDHWLVRAPKSRKELVSRAEVTDPVLGAFETLKARSTSPLSARSDEAAHHARSVVSSVKFLARQELRRRVKRAPPPIRPPDTTSASSKVVAERYSIKDPLFTAQWHLVNDEFPVHMMNVTGAWDMGYTGKGVISALVDDGLDYRNKDLTDNFDAAGSYDFNDHTDLPTPKMFDDHHGTRCAGQIAAIKNDVCGIGIAYESKVAGLRILSGPISDVDEAAALNYGYQNTSIYSCSWGPPDNGRSMEGPGYLIQKAVVNGINNGRGGKGSIFVFASGNGAAHGDQCNFDGYTNSIYSVTVSAVDYKGLHPYYSEPCAANMIVAYSSGSGKHIVTTDMGENNACATSHGGTSAAAPNAVGVFALALEARPDLTWRDIQYLCVETAGIINPEDPDWEPTHSGQLYSYKYGFGVLDAYRYITAAKDWQLVKPQVWFAPDAVQINDGKMTKDEKFSGGEPIGPSGVKSSIKVTRDQLDSHNFDKLEHINVKVWISHSKRGDVEVEVISPKGIKSVLAGARYGDMADTGFPGWTFMSIKHWGEDPVGDWTIKVSDQKTPKENGTFHGWSMMFWGSAIDPDKTSKFELQPDDNLLPPSLNLNAPTVTVHPTSTKTHTKPTAHLPPDHGDAEGENSHPAFPGQADAANPSETAKPTSTPTPDEGWFSDMSNLVSSQKWLFGAVGAVAVFGIATLIFFWRRRVAQRKLATYTSLPGGDNVAMSSLRDGATGAPRTRELYDAFGEVSDDEEADEHTQLRGPGRSTGGIGFHSGFLDDDDPSTAGPTPKYRDEPDSGRTPREPERRPTENVPSSPSGSGDGSWEHASQTR